MVVMEITMDAAALRAMQAPLKERYRGEPEAASGNRYLVGRRR